MQNSEGPLCTLCDRIISRKRVCLKCEASQSSTRVITAVGIIFFVIFVILFQRKRISRFLNSHKHGLRHVFRS